MKQHLIPEPPLNGQGDWTLFIKNVDCPPAWGEGSRGLAFVGGDEDWLCWPNLGKTSKADDTWGVEVP